MQPCIYCVCIGRMPFIFLVVHFFPRRIDSYNYGRKGFGYKAQPQEDKKMCNDEKLICMSVNRRIHQWHARNVHLSRKLAYAMTQCVSANYVHVHYTDKSDVISSMNSRLLFLILLSLAPSPASPFQLRHAICNCSRTHKHSRVVRVFSSFFSDIVLFIVTAEAHIQT